MEIIEIENDMRRVPSAIAAGALKNCYLKCGGDPANFKFLAGEKALIKKMATIVKQKGIQHFLKKIKVSTASGPANCNVQDIGIKIVDYYQKRYLRNSKTVILNFS